MTSALILLPARAKVTSIFTFTRANTTLHVHNSTRHNSTRHNSTRPNPTRLQLNTPKLDTPQLYTDHMAVRLKHLYSSERYEQRYRWYSYFFVG